MDNSTKGHTDTPNFLRLAHELNKFNRPRKAADLILSVAGAVLEEADHDKQ